MADEYNLASLRRTCRGATYLLQHLGHDARVLAAFDTWCRARNITEDRFRQAWAGSDADRQRLIATTHADPDESRAWITRFAHDDLRLTFPWLPSALQRTFVLWVENGVHRQRRHILSLWPDAVSALTLQPGRNRTTLSRDVAWFYRTRVQDPPDHVKDIAEEEKRAAEQRGVHLKDVHSKVSQACTRAERWLNHEITFSWDVNT